MISPKVLNDVFDNKSFLILKNSAKNIKEIGQFDPSFSRWTVSDDANQQLKLFFGNLTDLARSVFKSKSLIPTYSLISHYEGPKASLKKHKDDNACTYTLDLCLYQKTPWDLYVEGVPYTLQPNQALAYYGNDQEHWREDFPEPESNYVAMVFFHFAEPDHWWFNYGRRYADVIKAENLIY